MSLSVFNVSKLAFDQEKDLWMKEKEALQNEVQLAEAKYKKSLAEA